MPAEQRIIGGGLLIVGVAIVLVLLYAFKAPRTTPDEAREKLLKEIWPAMNAAEEKGDYGRMREVAREASDLLRTAGSTALLNAIQGAATTDREALRLRKAIEEKRFEKNSEDLFEHEGGWYPSETHRILARLRDGIEKKLPQLRRFRETAASLEESLADAREGSGLPLAASELRWPAAGGGANPVRESDEAALRPFSVDAKELERALVTKDSGGRATSARLRWNQRAQVGTVATALASMTADLEALWSAIHAVESDFRSAAADARAAPALPALRRKLADAAAAGIAPDKRAAFEKERSAMEEPDRAIQAMRAAVEALRPTLVNVRELAPLLKKPFA